MKDKNIPDDIKSISLNELTEQANNIIEKLEKEKDLENSMARAREAGIDPSRIVLDPGFEHGKTTSENLLMLTNLDLLANSQRPVLVSFSGKRFLPASVRSTQDELQYAEMADVMGLFAPNPVVLVAGNHDNIFPISAPRKAFNDLKAIYEASGTPESCHLVIGPGGHRFYAEQAWPVMLDELYR